MGLLTDPRAEEQNKLILFLQKHDGKISILSYIVGLVWLVFLANAQYSLGTYFSENALLPGLVDESFHEGFKAENYLSQLLEKDASKNPVTVEHIYNLFQAIGFLEVELQNYTVRDPVTKEMDQPGTNVYAILRAKRSAGTESLVFNTPIFPNNGHGRKNLAGVAVMLALAEYFQNQVYWAKDIVFLVAEGHLGTLAWVKGHQSIRNDDDNVKFENVHAKAGNIQTAVNFILESNKVCSLNTRFHGINGQLPNLDLVNLLNKFIVNDAEKRSNWKQDVWKLLSYMQTQSTGTPTGSHGFFLKYGIESVTLFGKGGRACKSRYSISFGDIGKILEASFRSLNNLLERLHQSFFFYLKTTPNRFVSIGLYFPPLALILFPILLKGASVWLTTPDLAASQGLFKCAVVHTFAISSRWLLSNLHLIKPYLFPSIEMTSELFLHVVTFFTTLQFIICAMCIKKCETSLSHAIYCFSLLEFATTLYSLALFNPSLVIFVGTFSGPLLTFFFKFRPARKPYLFIFLLSSMVALLGINYFNLVTPVNKYFYEAEVYGNFLFDFAYLIGLPVIFSILCTI